MPRVPTAAQHRREVTPWVSMGTAATAGSADGLHCFLPQQVRGSRARAWLPWLARGLPRGRAGAGRKGAGRAAQGRALQGSAAQGAPPAPRCACTAAAPPAGSGGKCGPPSRRSWAPPCPRGADAAAGAEGQGWGAGAGDRSVSRTHVVVLAANLLQFIQEAAVCLPSACLHDHTTPQHMHRCSGSISCGSSVAHLQDGVCGPVGIVHIHPSRSDTQALCLHQLRQAPGRLSLHLPAAQVCKQALVGQTTMLKHVFSNSAGAFECLKDSCQAKGALAMWAQHAGCKAAAPRRLLPGAPDSARPSSSSRRRRSGCSASSMTLRSRGLLNRCLQARQSAAGMVCSTALPTAPCCQRTQHVTQQAGKLVLTSTAASCTDWCSAWAP